MMQRCFQADELGDLLELTEDDSRQKHLDACPRCRALLAEYKEFLEPSGEELAGAPGADLKDAEASLQAVMEREIKGVGGGEEGAGLEGAESVGRRVKGAELGADRTDRRAGDAGSVVKRMFASRAFRWPLTAAAAACILLLVYSFFERWPLERDGIVLREELPDDAAGAESILELFPVERLPNNTLRLAWKPVADADAYEVHLFTPELDELAVFGPVKESFLILDLRNIAGLP
jgi:hypothetical protein